MVRNQKRKSRIGLHSELDMREAVALIEEGQTIRAAASLKNVSFSTLYRYYKKKKQSEESGLPMRFTPNYTVRRIFSETQEASLKEYLVTCSKMAYGLDTIETRKLAYQLAKHHKLAIPQPWEDREMAGIDWLHSFRNRHPDLSLRKPEPCSLSRATSFNRHNVNQFFDNLETVMKRQTGFSDGTRVFALDETGTTTVQKPKKIIALKGSKQLNKVTSGERGTLVTSCCIVSATGSSLPPAMVFPRKNFKPYMINKAPPGTLGLAQPTGWMNSQLFADVMRHFVRVTGSSKDNPSLLIVDNHESHLSPEALNIAKDNGVTLLTIPPHTSHKLQPLDVSVFGPLQKYYNAALDSWMMRNPGVPMSIYSVAEIFGISFEKAMTPVNIKSGFLKTGIFPFDRNAFSDDDFMPSEVTNRQVPCRQDNIEESQQQYIPPITASTSQNQINELVLPEHLPAQELQRTPERYFSQSNNMNENSSLVPPIQNNITITQNASNILRSPLECRDYPKAQPRSDSLKGRKRGRTLIATDTPIKKDLEDQARLRQQKKDFKGPIIKTARKEVKKVTKELFSSEDSDTSSASSKDFPLSAYAPPLKNDFVIVKFSAKKSKYYIGKLLSEYDSENDEYEISYLRKSLKSEGFCFPIQPDIAVVSRSDIELVVKPREAKTKTKRQSNIYFFRKNLLKIFNLR